MELKEATYKYGAGSHPAHVVYLRRGDDIYFTSSDGEPWTVQYAEGVVNAICDAEGIQRQDVTFYDIQTHSGGYRSDDPTYYCVDRLILKPEGEYYYANGWVCVARQEYGHVLTQLYGKKLSGIPDEVREAFAQYLH